MRRAHAAAAKQLQVSASGPEVWRWQGRTLGRRAGDCWLRIVTAELDKAGGRLWEGTATADTHVPRTVPRPQLRDVLDWTSRDVAFRAELTEYVSVPPVTSGTPALGQDIALPDSWWADLKSALGALATVPTDRESVRQNWADRNLRRFLGIAPVRIRETTTGHADLHCATSPARPWSCSTGRTGESARRLRPGSASRVLAGRTGDRRPDPARVRPRPRHGRRPDRGAHRPRATPPSVLPGRPPSPRPARRPPGRALHRHPRTHALTTTPPPTAWRNPCAAHASTSLF